MSASRQLVVFRLDERRYALPLEAVERVVHSVEVTPLPDAPRLILGIISMGGRVLPVLDVRRRFGLPAREMSPADGFLVARMTRRTVALLIDEATELIERRVEEIVDPAGIAPGLGHIRGVVTLDDGLVLIHDLEKFLSLEEANSLDEALKQEVARAR